MSHGERVHARVRPHGKPLSETVTVLGADVDLSMGQESQVVLRVLDADLHHLSAGTLMRGVPADIDGHPYVISVVEVSAGSTGRGELTVTLRPLFVQRLKARKGAMVLNNVSPTNFVEHECASVGAPFVVQPSPARPSVRRDADQPDDSSWTTFNRLAQELGYVVFEAHGRVHFGQPSWLLARQEQADDAVLVGWSTADQSIRPHALPSIRTSEDAPEEVTVSLSLPATRFSEGLYPGRAVKLTAFPRFIRHYLVDSVSYSLLPDYSAIDVGALVPSDPAPQPPAQDEAGAAFPHEPQGASAPATIGYVWPMRGTITSKFGQRRGRLHAGIDIAAPTGTPIVAVRAGRVAKAGTVGGYGTAVYLDHGGVLTRYGHFSRLNVRVGQQVAQGQQIGACGATGKATGPHLHFEVRPGDSPTDPLRVLP